MDFSWSEEHKGLYSKLLLLAQQKLNSEKESRLQYWSRDQWRLCGELGLLGLSVPTDYGGDGYNALTTARALEAFGRGCRDMGLVFSSAAHLFACCMPIVEYGSEEMKRAALPKLCSGEYIGANAITEKEAGSDVFALKTQAVSDGSSYILTGAKSYVSNGPFADVFVVYATTNPAHGYLGITGFLIEKGTPGLIVGEPFHKMGLTSTPACQIQLQECRVPQSNRLGAQGQGSLIFKNSMQWERCCLFASYIGAMDRQLEQTIRYTSERRQFGKAIGKHQAVAHRLADMKLRLEAARLLLYQACWCFDQGKDAALEISLSKLAISEAAIQSSLDALHLHGSAGFNEEGGIEHMLRDAIPSTIFSGTSEMQRDIIASELLRMASEPSGYFSQSSR
jgi:alkylation response protein AidB-like acyl-CoA dehydrogenase